MSGAFLGHSLGIPGAFLGPARRNARSRLKPYGLVRLHLPLGLITSHGLARKGLAEFTRSAYSAKPGK